jgi:hypothetical protein
MAKLMRDAFKDAYAKQGLELPVSEGTSRHSKPVAVINQRKSQPAKQPSSVNDKWKSGAKELRPNARNLSQPAKNSANKPKAQKTIKKSQPVQPNNAQQIYADLAAAYGSVKNKVEKSEPLPEPTTEPYTLTTGPDAKVHPFFSKKLREYQVITHKHRGIAEQPLGAEKADDVRELVIGLDFGTSSVKVIVGDRYAGKAFAVPFSDANGIDSYLLPSRLWETDGHYSLESGKKVHRNLKLSLLASGDISKSYQRATVFLALVLRHVRAWLFTQHAEIYNGKRIVWKLVLGMPAENYADTLLVERFHLLARSVWVLAGKRCKEISTDIVEQVISRVNQLEERNAAKPAPEEVFVEVVPELSAQIFGFLRSNRFDKNAKNNFVMVDVGAGTVDSALFHVKKERGRWHFEFYTNHVLPNGVMNLHRARIDWWSQALQDQPTPATNLLDALHKSEMPTDQLGTIPERLEDYVSGVTVKFNDGKVHPDTEFFKEVCNQVRGKTIYRAWVGYKENDVVKGFLSRADLENVPLFLCGGGARLNFYHRLEEELRNFPGCTWLKARPQPLGMPENLEAPGLIKQEYDRLSVAYGLSFLDVGKIVKALPPPVAPSSKEPSWHFTDRFIDKDQV